jgi:glycosyltransferase involved in cell wall biosynthesis
VLQLGGPMGLYGAERWILALARNTDAHEADMVVGVLKDAPGAEPPLTMAARALGLAAPVFEAYGRTSWDAREQIRRFVLDNDIQVLHSHGYKTDLMAAVAARGTPCKLVSTPHGWSTKAGLKLQLYETLDRLAFARFDAVVPLSQDLYDGLARLPWVRRRLTLIPNGVDLRELDAGVEPSRSDAPQRGSRCMLGYVGQLIPRKGLTTLLHAVSNLPANVVELSIVGEGPQRAELEHLAVQLGIADRVCFLGFREDRIAIMRTFDLFVLPSELEGIPRCLMESMALGIPVIATDIPGCRTLIEPGATGELFAVGDDRGLADAIAKLVADTSKRRALAAHARARVRSEFSAATMSRRYIELYRRLVSSAAMKPS